MIVGATEVTPVGGGAADAHGSVIIHAHFE